MSTPWRSIWGVGVELYSFLTSALDVDEWSASRPEPLALHNPGKDPQ